MENKLVFGYDIMTFNGPIPNGLPFNMLSTIYEASEFDYSQSGQYFCDKHGFHWPVHNHGFYEYDKNYSKKTIYQIIEERELYNNNQKWFYILEPFGNIDTFFAKDGFLNKMIIENIPKKTLNEIINYNGNILIQFIIDGGLGITYENFVKLKHYFLNNKIPFDKVYMVFQDFKLQESLKLINLNCKFLNFNLALLAKSKEFNNTLKYPDFSFWGEEAIEPQAGKIQKRTSSIHTIQDINNSIESRIEKKNFLFFCRHSKLERLLTLDCLYKIGLEKNLVSWNKNLIAQSKVDLDKFLEKTENYTLYNMFLNEDRILDIDDITKIAGYGFETKKLYEESFISLVAESVFYQLNEFKTGYLSEKIWKPIGHCHPFILIGPSKSLQYLREIGFKTFDPYIDESYDIIENDEERLEKIFELVNNFSQKTLDEKYEFLKNVKDIVEFNQKHFLNFADENEKQYMVKYYDFLYKN